MAVTKIPKTASLKKTAKKRKKLGGGDGGLLSRKIEELKRDEKSG